MKNKLFVKFTLVLVAFFLLPLVAEGAVPTAKEIAGTWSGEATLVEDNLEGVTAHISKSSIPLEFNFNENGKGTATFDTYSGTATYQGGNINATFTIPGGEVYDYTGYFSGKAKKDGDRITIEGNFYFEAVILIDAGSTPAGSRGNAVFAWSVSKEIPPVAGEEPAGDEDIPTLTEPEEGKTGSNVDDFDYDSWDHDWSPAHIPDGFEELPDDDDIPTLTDPGSSTDEDYPERNWDFDDFCDCEDDPWKKHVGPLGAAIISIIAAAAAILGGVGGTAGGALAGALAEVLGTTGLESLVAGSADGVYVEGKPTGETRETEGEESAGEEKNGEPIVEDFVLVDPATGAETLYERDPVTGQWVDPHSGSILDPGRLPDWLRQRTDDQSWIGTQNQRIARGDTSLDRRLAAEDAKRAEQRARDEKIDLLKHIAQRANRYPQSDLHNNIRDNANKLADKLLSGEQVSQEAVDRVARVFGKSATGQILSHSQMPKVPSDWSLAKDAAIAAAEEVSRNETMAAVAVRSLSAVVTLGQSEIVFQSHKGYLRMRDYIDEGHDSATGAFMTAAWGATKDFVVSKTADKIMGKTGSYIDKNTSPSTFKEPVLKALGRLESIDPKAAETVKRVVYDQIKRFPRQGVNAADRHTLNINGKMKRQIGKIFQ